MRNFKLAVWKLGITIVQLNEINPQTGRLELRRYNPDGSWTVAD